MKRAIVFLAALVALSATAAPMVMVSGNAAAQRAAEDAAAAGARALSKPGSCYWQVPGFQRWVNTNAVSVTVGPRGSLTIYYGYRTEVEVAAMNVEAGSALAASFLARIEECRK